MLPFSEQIAAILEYALVFAGIAYLCWLMFSPGGRALRLRAPALAPWDLDPARLFAMAWLVLVVGLLGPAAVPMVFGAGLRARPEGQTLEMVVSGSMLPVGVILASLLVRVFRRRWLQGAYDSDRRPSFGASLRGGFLTFLAVLPIVSAVSVGWIWLLERVGLPTANQELVTFFAEAQSPLLIGTMTTLALVVAPIGEELVFRAGIFRYLRTRLPRWLAFTISGGVFAALHLNWVSFLPLFVLGVIFAIAYERTGRISVAMLAHALFNLNTLLIVLSHAPV